MLSHIVPLLQAAEAGGYALGGFNVYNLEGVKAVVAAAEAERSPALLQVHPGALAHGGWLLPSLCIAAAQASDMPIGVHLDHSTDLRVLARAMEAGVSSVMADGSHLPLSDNIQFVRRAVATAHARHIAVEAELGRISGTEDGLTVAAIDARMTDPDQARAFVDETGVDALAVCIGNIHGPYPFPPQLDFERLEQINTRVTVPLVLHGASGLDDYWIRGAIERGVRKFNVNTEVRRAGLGALRGALTKNPEIDLVPLMRSAVDAMQAVAQAKMRLFGSSGKT